ncbi:Flp pilus assembly protein TadB [Arthrobacter sp. CAN_A6]|uniref:hypothetical protein n=1 Tax=Arthrobacter sp. CAN_A6 TaxID=2787721 RepID=UPI0018CB43CF
MAELKGIDVKLRAAFLVPAMVIIVALTLIDAFVTDISYLTVWVFPVVVFTAIISMMVTERRRRRRIPD